MKFFNVSLSLYILVNESIRNVLWKDGKYTKNSITWYSPINICLKLLFCFKTNKIITENICNFKY